MESIVAHMIAGNIIERRSKLQFTVLHCPGGTWSDVEISRLVNGLTTEAYQLPAKPEHVILYGHHTKAKTLEAMWGGMAYTATEVTGYDSELLPFKPSNF